MRSSKTYQSVLHLSLKRRQPKRERTVHELLSQHQAAYAVFVPKPEDFFKLFEVIFLHHDRPRSPRTTNTNLCEIFEDLHLQDDDETGCDEKFVEAFLKQFEKVSHLDITRDPERYTVSEESLRRAGLEITTPGPRIGTKLSKMRTLYRQLRLSWLYSDAYTGRKKLQKLIWKHGEAVFLLMLQELDGEDFSTAVGDRSLMGIVTKRLITKVGISRLDGTGASGSICSDAGAVPGGVGANLGMENINAFREEYDDKIGVSGLHFILFRVERLDRYRWKFYKGIDVCDSELDEDANMDLLRRDGLYRAGRWLRGAESANNGAASDYRIVTNEDSTRSRTSRVDSTSDALRKGDDLEYVEVKNEFETAPFLDIDITPVLSEFACKQCKQAAYYRKAFRRNSGKASRAVSILRSVLRKCRFESTIRALYDLSGCYLRGIGVQVDNNMGGLLRYCAGGMRRNYVSRSWWLRRLVMEIGFRLDVAPERSIGTMALLCRWRLVSNDAEAVCNYGRLIEKLEAGFARDAVREKEPYEEVIKEGCHVPAMYKLAVLLEKGTEGVHTDAVRAKDLYEEAIKEGSDISAMNNLKLLLEEEDEGVGVDTVQAKELCEEAIKGRRDVYMMNNLQGCSSHGVLLEEGAEGVGVDAVRAKEIYEEAIKEGHYPPAMYNLGLLLENGPKSVDVDTVRAKELYKEAIKEGHYPRAKDNLGQWLEKGPEVVSVSAVRVKELFEKAINESHYAFALYGLWPLLEKGAEADGVHAVRRKELFEEAIKEGLDVYGIYNVAELLVKGAERLGIDAERAKELYEDADKEGGHEGKEAIKARLDVLALYNVALLLVKGTGRVRVDAVRAKELYEDTIKGGLDLYAMYNITGLLVKEAEWVGIDAVRAKELLEEAARATEGENSIKEAKEARARNHFSEGVGVLNQGSESMEPDKARTSKLRLKRRKSGASKRSCCIM